MRPEVIRISQMTPDQSVICILGTNKIPDNLMLSKSEKEFARKKLSENKDTPEWVYTAFSLHLHRSPSPPSKPILAKFTRIKTCLHPLSFVRQLRLFSVRICIVQNERRRLWLTKRN